MKTGAELVSVVLFAGLFLNYVLQVFMRYVMNDPLVWTLEAAGILFIAVSLWTAATLMPFGEHVSFDLVHGRVGPTIRRVMTTISLGAFLILALWSIPDTVRVLDFMYDERTYALEFNLGHLFVLMMFFLLAYAARAGLAVWRIWRDEPGEDEVP